MAAKAKRPFKAEGIIIATTAAPEQDHAEVNLPTPRQQHQVRNPRGSKH